MTILIKKKHPKLPISTMPVRLFLKKAMLMMGLKDKEISVFFTDDEGIQELNRIYRGKNLPTNVLAFSLLEAGTPPKVDKKLEEEIALEGEGILEIEETEIKPPQIGAGLMEAAIGDIVISVETAQREAKQANIAYEDIIDSLLLHGLLHLVGYDHENVTKAQAEQMFAKEDEIFSHIKGYSLER